MENYSQLKSFLEDYTFCPKCNSPLVLSAREEDDYNNSHKFEITKSPDGLLINITSNYFIRPEQNDFFFSISIENGDVIGCRSTEKFVSLYDLHIIIDKHCNNCYKNSEQFRQVINLYYDIDLKCFNAKKILDQFSFVFDEDYYSFLNNYVTNVSFISMHGSQYVKPQNAFSAPIFPLSYFNFSSNEALFHKLNSIRLLL